MRRLPFLLLSCGLIGLAAAVMPPAQSKAQDTNPLFDVINSVTAPPIEFNVVVKGQRVAVKTPPRFYIQLDSRTGKAQTVVRDPDGKISPCEFRFAGDTLKVKALGEDVPVVVHQDGITIQWAASRWHYGP